MVLCLPCLKRTATERIFWRGCRFIRYLSYPAIFEALIGRIKSVLPIFARSKTKAKLFFYRCPGGAWLAGVTRLGTGDLPPIFQILQSSAEFAQHDFGPTDHHPNPSSRGHRIARVEDL
jgi:hypothetical protein